jgi:hypothetical protein
MFNISMKTSIYLLSIFFLLLLSHSLDAQHEHDMESIYLIGNAAETSSGWVDKLIENINDSSTESTVYFLGDLTDKNGIRKKPKSKNRERLKSYKKIKKETDAKVYFISGDRDWDNSGPDGMTKVKHLEDYIEEDLKLKKRFVPSHACPGPHVVQENDHFVTIVINSQWFIHPHARPEAPATDCHIVFETDFWDELEDILDDAKEKHVLLLAHHPIYSFGQHNGRKLGKKHLIPIYGTLYSSFIDNVGRPSDLAFPRYQAYVEKLRDIMHDHNSLIYASGHDFYNSVLAHENNIYLNTSISNKNKSWANDDGLFYASKNPSFLKLDYDEEGNVRCRFLSADKLHSDSEEIHLFSESENNESIYRCHFAEEQEELDPISEEAASLDIKDLQSTITTAGIEYKAGRTTEKWLGKNYRDEWTQKVSVPYLDIENLHGGLRPYARGGGLQTNSLKLKAGDGQNYVFRAVNKNPERSLDELVSQTIYRQITKQLITTQHPYGGLVASSLLDATDILHARPTLYIMPDDPELGIYRASFGNVLGFLEIKPKTLKKKKGKTFGEAKSIVSTHQMLRAMYKNHKHRMDPLAFAKARIFDMWIGDWDKHEDQWKWAVYEEGEFSIYRPIPRDRDHVFSKWEGIIPSVADMVISNAEDFDYTFGNLTHLNFKARFLDRRFAGEISHELWLEAVRYVQEKMTDEHIDNSMLAFPSELNNDRIEEIREKLKSRREELPEMILNYLNNLEEDLSILGSNKKEIFKATRLDNGNVRVTVEHLTSKGNVKETFYNREIAMDTTQTIYLYGLGGDDKFIVAGEVEKSIKLRIIPGKGKDEINDRSQIANSKNLTQIYQGSEEDDEITKGNETIIKRPYRTAHYEYSAYQLDGLLPFLSFEAGGFNGFGIIADVRQTKQGFNKPQFAKKHQYNIKYFPKIQAYRAEYEYTFRHFLKDWDFNTKHIISNQFDKYPQFLGLGTATVIDSELREQGFYRIDFKTYRARVGLEKPILFKSNLAFYLNYEVNDVGQINDEPNVLQLPEFQDLVGLGVNHSIDFQTSLKLDFRDHKASSHKGSLLNFGHRLYRSLTLGSWGGNVDLNLSHYETINIGTPLTLVGRAGTINSYGELPFYQQSILASNTYQRGYDRNRFVGEHAAFYNLEARLEIGTWYNLIVPVTFGVLGFFDQGAVWDDFAEINDTDFQWRETIGIGAFAAPLSRDFTFSMSYAFSDEDRNFFDLRFGFNLNKI